MSLMQVVGASFANLPLSHTNSLLSQLCVPASQPAQSQTQPTEAQFSDPLPCDTQNTRLKHKPATASDLQSRKPRVADQQCVETDPGMKTHEEMTRLNPQVKPLNGVLYQRCSVLLDHLLIYFFSCLASGNTTADHSS